MKLTDEGKFFAWLGRVPKRATKEQMRAAFKQGADMFIEGAVSRGYLEERDGYFYPTAAGKRAVADRRSARK